METLINNLKTQIIEELNLEVDPQEITADEPLFGEGLGLDSIDGLELVVMVEKNYGIKLENNEEINEIFTSLRTLANYIDENVAAAA